MKAVTTTTRRSKRSDVPSRSFATWPYPARRPAFPRVLPVAGNPLCEIPLPVPPLEKALLMDARIGSFHAKGIAVLERPTLHHHGCRYAETRAISAIAPCGARIFAPLIQSRAVAHTLH